MDARSIWIMQACLLRAPEVGTRPMKVYGMTIDLEDMDMDIDGLQTQWWRPGRL